MHDTALRGCRDPHLAGVLMQDCLVNLINNISSIRKLDCCTIEAYIVIFDIAEAELTDDYELHFEDYVLTAADLRSGSWRNGDAPILK